AVLHEAQLEPQLLGHLLQAFEQFVGQGLAPWMAAVLELPFIGAEPPPEVAGRRHAVPASVGEGTSMHGCTPSGTQPGQRRARAASGHRRAAPCPVVIPARPPPRRLRWCGVGNTALRRRATRRCATPRGWRAGGRGGRDPDPLVSTRTPR